MKVKVPAVPPEGSHSLDQQRRAGVTRTLRRFSEPEQDRGSGRSSCRLIGIQRIKNEDQHNLNTGLR